MQSVTPNIMLGGSGNYSFRQGSLERAVGGMYTLGEHVLAAQWDHQVLWKEGCMYVCMRKAKAKLSAIE